MMSKETYMKNNMQSHNLFLIINVIVCSLLDLFIAIAIIVYRFDALSCIIAVFLVVLDITLLLKCIFTNFHFKYYLYELLFHGAIFFVAGMLFLTSFSGLASATTYMNTFSTIIFIASHLIQLVTYILMIPFTKRKKVLKNKIISIVILTIYIAIVGFYVGYISQNGIFGQTSERRSLVNQYLYNEEDDTYSIVDYHGRGTIISVPESFDGKPVKEVFINDTFLRGETIEIYFDDEEEYPTLSLSEEVLANPEQLNIKFFVKRSTINTFQEYLVNTFSSTVSYNLVNNVVPSDIEDDNVYINFFYNTETINFIKSSYQAGEMELFPMWIGRRGAAFTSNFLDNTEYGEMAKSLNVPNNSFDYYEEDLALSYQRFNGYVLSPLKFSTGEYLVGRPINQNETVNVQFEQIYAVNFSDDNDLYYENNSYKHLCNDQSLLKVRYATYQNLDQILDNYERRNGFELQFYDNQKATVVSSLTSHFDASSDTTIDIRPHWTLIPTTISSVTTNNQNNQFTYGDDVMVNVQTANLPIAGIEYIYRLYKDGLLIESGSSLNFNNVDPAFSGGYSVIVLSRAQSDNMITSCTAQSSPFAFDIDVSKRTIEVGYQEQSFIYNASSQTITLVYDENIIINNDTITFDVRYNDLLSMRDAGNYSVDVFLSEGQDKYQLNVLFDTITVAPYILSVTWDSQQSFTYDGTSHHPSYQINNALSETVELVEEGQAINANNQNEQYAFTIALNGEDSNNYRLNEANLTTQSRNYTIEKRVVNDIAYKNNQQTFVYNAMQQAPVVESLGNLASSDSQEVIIASLIYEYSTATKVMPQNFGNYEMKMSFPDNSNYVLNTAIDTLPFTIEKQLITISYDDGDKTYNGQAQSFDVQISGAVNTNEARNDLVYNNANNEQQINYRQTNASTYDTVVTLQPTSNYRLSSDYHFTFTIHRYEINDMALNANTFTYDGQQKSVTVRTTQQTIYRNLSFTYRFDSTPLNVGEYVVTVTYDDPNYVSKEHTFPVTINKRSISLSYQNPNWTYNGLQQTATFTNSNISGAVSSEINDIIANLSYTNNTATDVGSYTFTVALNEATNPTIYNNYQLVGTNEFTFDIVKRNITLNYSSPSLTYDGTAKTVLITSVTNVVASQTQSVNNALIYSGNTATAAGSHTFTVSINEELYPLIAQNYQITGTRSFTFEIAKKDITLVYSSPTLTYNGLEQTVGIASIEGTVLNQEAEVLSSLIYLNNTKTNAGSYTFTVSLPTTSNYQIAGTSSFTFDIAKKDITLIYSSPTLTYNGTVQTVLLTGVDGAVQNEEEEVLSSIIYSNNRQTNAGSYTFTVSLPTTSNYQIEGASSFTFEIAKKDITLVYSSPSLTYNGSLQTVRVTGVDGAVSNQQQAVLNSLTYSGNSQTNAGSYNFTVSIPATSNYQITGTRTFTYNIAKRGITLVYSSPILTYNGTSQVAGVTRIEGEVSGEEEMILTTLLIYTNNAKTDAGTYNFTVSLFANTNYQLLEDDEIVEQCEFTFTIAKKEITSITFTAKEYNGQNQNPEIASVVGLVADEHLVEISNALQQTIGTNEYVNASTYQIAISLSDTSNYTIEESFPYTIEKQKITLSVQESIITYDGEDHLFNVIINGASNMEEASNALIFTGNTTGNEVGEYTFNVSIDEDANYQLVDENQQPINEVTFTCHIQEVREG